MSDKQTPKDVCGEAKGREGYQQLKPKGTQGSLGPTYCTLESYLDGVIDNEENQEPGIFLRIFLFYFFICNSDIKIQEYRNNTLNSSSATSMLLKLVPIPVTFFCFFDLLLSSLARRL